MPEFLVRIVVRRPERVRDDDWAALLEKEREVGLRLRRGGVIGRMWRVPGTTGNLGIWNALDASELHREVSSLPLFRYMTVQVEALAQHYLEQDHVAEQP